MKPIRLVLTSPAEKLGATTSRFWGNPALPAHVPYPTYEDDDGETYPYVFLCQINLGELAAAFPATQLPREGLLLFFAKIDAYLGYEGYYEISGYVSDADAVKVIWIADTDGVEEITLLDENDVPFNPSELKINFSSERKAYGDEHELFAEPEHREWETWEPPYEDRIILLQVDSFSGDDFELNFMDSGVLDFLISPRALRKHDFTDVRGIVLST